MLNVGERQIVFNYTVADPGKVKGGDAIPFMIDITIKLSVLGLTEEPFQ